MITNTSSSPYVKLRSVNIGGVKWTDGFWAERFDVCHQVMIPDMWRTLKDPNISHAYTNFLVAAGLEEGEHKGPPFFDGDLYKWLEAAAYVYGITRDEKLDQLMDEIIEVIGQAQREDGYIHTPVVIKQRHGDKDTREFANRIDFEMYNFGHLMTTACIYYRATGKTTLLDVADKLSDYLYAVFKDPVPELAKHSIRPSHFMGLVEMYRTTGDQKHLELAKILVSTRDLMEDGSDHNQDRIPFHEQTKAVGHAVRANYLYAGVADLYAEIGDESLLSVLETIWQNVAFQKMYITGACGALYDGASPDGPSDRAAIKLVHQAYGREYQLPNITAYNESCANLGNLFWNWRMLTVTGEARFADIVELVLYNSALSGISLDGKRFFYTNTLRQEDELPFELRWPHTREHYISCYCCPPNIVRSIAEAGSYAYSISDEGVWVHLYGGNVLDTELGDGSKLKLTQETDYPWDGKVKITVDVSEKNDFAVMLRIPGWVTGAMLKVNGQDQQDDLQPGRYVVLHRMWSTGDVIELDLPMRVMLIEAHPLVEECRNQVAIKRGPVVYCLESIDLPEDVKVSEVAIPHDIELKPQSGDSVLKDIIVLEGKAEVVEEGNWSDQLYREFRSQPAKMIDTRFIPYYAWDNRGLSEMAVWLPVR